MKDENLRDDNLSSLQVDVFQVAVMEIQVTAVSFLISELHQVCGRHRFHSITHYRFNANLKQCGTLMI